MWATINCRLQVLGLYIFVGGILFRRAYKVQEMKEEEYTKSLAKNQVCEIIHRRDISKNFLLKSIRL